MSETITPAAPGPEAKRRKNRRLPIILATTAVVVAGFFGGGVAWASDYQTKGQESYASQSARAEAKIQNLKLSIENLRSTIDLAEESLATSEGKTLEGNTSRDDLSLAIKSAKSAFYSSKGSQNAAANLAVIADEVTTGSHLLRFDEALDRISKIELKDAKKLAVKAVDLLTASNKAVLEAVSAWEVEQERIAAELAAAEAAAAEAAAEAAAQAASERTVGYSISSNSRSDGASSGAEASSGVDWNIYVRAASIHGEGAQALIDAGGQIAVDYGVGLTGIAAHNYHDSSALSMSDGELVQLSGAYSGLYRVSGSVVVETGSNAAAAFAAIGTSLAMQTCQWGNGMTILVGLVPA